MSEEFKSESAKKNEDWMNSKWRPMMGWLYMGVCAFDFVMFPILWSALQAVMKVGTITQWQPLTLQGAGLFHIAMGAVLGIAALGRTQEKLAGANNGGATPTLPTGGFTAPSAPSAGFGASTGGFSAPTPAPAPSSFGGGGFGSPSPTPSFGGGFAAPATIATTASGKKIVPTDDPVL
jgi:Holin of 3TMs, for gene-transfer release